MESHTPNKSTVEDLQDSISRIERLLGSDPVAAEAATVRLLQDAPGHPMLLLFQGIARRLLKNPASAIEVLKPLCEAWPQAPLARLQLGLAQREMGDDAVALASLRQAVAARPDFADGWHALADLLTAMGDSSGANDAFGMYIRHSAQDPHLLPIGAALREKRLADAEKLLRRRLGTHPTDVVALCMLADVLEQGGVMEEAYTLLERCLELAPCYERARHNHAVMLLRQNKAEEALRECERMLADDPGNRDGRKLRAAILVRLLDYEEAIKMCEGLLSEDPDQPEIWTSLGHMLKSVGRRDQSVAAYRKAIALAPHFGEPFWSLANLKAHQMDEVDIDAMRSQLARPGLTDKDRTHFHFALGRALEDRGEFADSFCSYAEGNRLRLERGGYDIDAFSRHVGRSKALFDAAFFSRRAGLGAPDPDPIFIVGLPRSGSTLVEQILASHSAVEGTMELTNIAAIAKSLDDSKSGSDEPGYPEVLGTLDGEALRALGERYLDETRVHRILGKSLFIDKMPNNAAHIGLIHLILPNARIIDICRHPMACGFSLFKEHFANAQLFSYSLKTIGQYYRYYVELMAHFDRVLPGRVHRVIYESLVEDTETEVRRLLDYCGLPFEATCLRFYENKRAVSTASSEQVRRPIFREGLEHWRHYEPWLEPLQAELGSLIESYAAMPTAE